MGKIIVLRATMNLQDNQMKGIHDELVRQKDAGILILPTYFELVTVLDNNDGPTQIGFNNSQE